MADVAQKTFLNLGSGHRKLLEGLAGDGPFAGWREVRVDLNADCAPDVVADLTDLQGVIADASADIVFCSHVLEHFHDHQVDRVLAEVARILRPDGVAIFKCPDLAQVVRLLDEEDLEREIYVSPAGPISILDILYGHRASITAGNLLMAHHTGFTENSLARRLLAAGFDEVKTQTSTSVDFCAMATHGPSPHDAQLRLLLAL